MKNSTMVTHIYIWLCVYCIFYSYSSCVNVLVFVDIRLHWGKMHPLFHMTYVHRQHFTNRKIIVLNFAVEHLDAVVCVSYNFNTKFFICNVLATGWCKLTIIITFPNGKKSIWRTVTFQCPYWTSFLLFVLDFMIFDVYE